MAILHKKLTNRKSYRSLALAVLILLLPLTLAPRHIPRKAKLKKNDAHLKRLNAWVNDPKIEKIENEARKVLGLQIYGAVECVDLPGNYIKLAASDPQMMYSLPEEVQPIKRVANLYKKRIPFIAHVQVYGGAGVSADSEVYLQDDRAIVGTRSGKIYEFWWSDSHRPDWTMIFSHKQWKKPTMKHKGNAILFFDADQEWTP